MSSNYSRYPYINDSYEIGKGKFKSSWYNWDQLKSAGSSQLTDLVNLAESSEFYLTNTDAALIFMLCSYGFLAYLED